MYDATDDTSIILPPGPGGHQQGLDTSTSAGKAMFQMLGVFAEFERAIIVERVNAGIARARQKGTKSGRAIGRPTAPSDKVDAAKVALASGMQEQINAGFLEASESAEQIHQAAAKPINAPGRHHVEPAPHRILQHLIQAGTVIPTLGAADACVFIG
jgi:hypothetical protein